MSIKSKELDNLFCNSSGQEKIALHNINSSRIPDDISSEKVEENKSFDEADSLHKQEVEKSSFCEEPIKTVSVYSRYSDIAYFLSLWSDKLTPFVQKYLPSDNSFRSDISCLIRFKSHLSQKCKDDDFLKFSTNSALSHNSEPPVELWFPNPQEQEKRLVNLIEKDEFELLSEIIKRTCSSLEVLSNHPDYLKTEISWCSDNKSPNSYLLELKCFLKDINLKSIKNRYKVVLQQCENLQKENKKLRSIIANQANSINLSQSIKMNVSSCTTSSESDS